MIIGTEYALIKTNNAFACREMCYFHEKCEAFIFVVEWANGDNSGGECYFKWGTGLETGETEHILQSGFKDCRKS